MLILTFCMSHGCIKKIWFFLGFNVPFLKVFVSPFFGSLKPLRFGVILKNDSHKKTFLESLTFKVILLGNLDISNYFT
ncbi:hypothetical protein Fmac_007901 [Flemingia macrophylla]|uniref:Uncharacterized protein n=1 Tax=Flemingia macrophylla TaxID=520843 RepID=A0ABD1MWC1_9FABA